VENPVGLLITPAHSDERPMVPSERRRQRDRGLREARTEGANRGWSSPSLGHRSRSLAIAACLIFCLPRCRNETQEPRGFEDSAQTDFMQWAQRRADRELRAFVDWALEKGLQTPPTEANVPLLEYGRDVGYECGPGRPRPEDGLCAGAHRDPSGWITLMTWKVDEPDAASVTFTGYTRVPLTCTDLKGTDIGKPFQEDSRLVLRLCQLQNAQALTQQRTFYGTPYALTRIAIYSESLIRFDRSVGSLIDRARRDALGP
jgi:hypothetical protein